MDTSGREISGLDRKVRHRAMQHHEPEHVDAEPFQHLNRFNAETDACALIPGLVEGHARAKPRDARTVRIGVNAVT